MQLGQKYSNEFVYDDFVQLYSHVRAEKTLSASGHQLIGSFLERYEEAAYAYRHAAEAAPNEPLYRYNEADTMITMGRLEDALMVTVNVTSPAEPFSCPADLRESSLLP